MNRAGPSSLSGLQVEMALALAHPGHKVLSVLLVLPARSVLRVLLALRVRLVLLVFRVRTA